MPELPEVETIRRGLNSRILNKKISRVKILNAKSFLNKNGEILAENSREIKPIFDAKIREIRRRGKLLLIDFANDFSLAIHLKMTGQLIFREKNLSEKVIKNGEENAKNFGGGHPTESFLADLPDKSTRVIFTFSDESKLFFNDQRKFGWIKFLPTREISKLNFVKKLGPEIANFTEKNSREKLEILENFAEKNSTKKRKKINENSQNNLKISAKNSKNFNEKIDENFGEKISEKTFAEFVSRARKHQNSGVKSVILNQEVVAGIGNIYADESLWGAKIHPAEKVKNLSDFELCEILKNAKIAMEKSLAAGGSTMKNYVRADGSRGNYLDKFANVFGRENLPCPRCKTPIIKIRVAGRGTHICPKCQKLKDEKSTKNIEKNLEISRKKSSKKLKKAAK